MLHLLQLSNDGADLHLDELFFELFKDWIVSYRGNVGRGAGYAILNQKIQEGRDVMAPVILTGTTSLDVERMIAMTTMLITIYQQNEANPPRGELQRDNSLGHG
jgi:hypothetical protein